MASAKFRKAGRKVAALATGRYTREYVDFINSPQWKVIRSLVILRDGHRCVKCGAKSDGKKTWLEVDHLVYPPRGSPFSAYYKQPLSDYQTLCNHCHKKKTRQTRRKKK